MTDAIIPAGFHKGIRSREEWEKHKSEVYIESCTDCLLQVPPEYKPEHNLKKLRIAVDLDGTLIEYTVWKGREHLGKALPGAHDAILKLFKEKHELILFTTRLHPGMCAKDGVSLKDEKKRIEEHLKAEGLGFFTELTGSKPLAEVYIDDRAVRHYDWKETLHELEAIQAKVKS